MDYKYIEQLLERYWLCETSLEEERILRTFFSQENVPVSLLPYKDLFTYEYQSLARRISLTERLKPLFKAAAIVAIFLTLGNAMQVAMQSDQPDELNMAEGYVEATDGVSVAIADTTHQDSMKMTEGPLLK